MKIAFCLHHFLPEYVAGTEIYTLRLAQQIRCRGIDVVILIPHFNYEVTGEYRWEGMRVIRYAESSIVDRKMIMGKRKPDGLHEFEIVIDNEKPDIVHFHELAPG